MQNKLAYFIAFLLLFSPHIKAATLKGHITDSKTHEPLIGATIVDNENNLLHDLARLDGYYILKNIKPGKHVLSVQYLGYLKQEKEIEVRNDNEVINLDILLEQDAKMLDQVEVVAHQDNGSNQYAMNREKASSNVLNVMSAKTIELSPDITVANVLQRVSGVSVQKTANSGEGQYAIIRGMDKRYNYTLVNGIKIPSPDDKNRYVPMDLFPSELISSLEVIKALTPENEGDAIGGAMNLVLRDAPESFLLNINMSAGYNLLFADRPFYQFSTSAVNLKSPAERFGANYTATPGDFTINNLKFKPVKPMPNFNGGLSIGNRFFRNRLGIIFSLSNQNSYSGSDGFFAVPGAQPNPNNTPEFELSQVRTYSTLQNRFGIHTKIDYLINKNNKISFYAAYFQLDKYISRHIVETSLATGVGNVLTYDRSQTQLQSIYSATLQGAHALLDQFRFDWSLVDSKASANNPDEVEINYNSTVIDNPTLQPIKHIWSHNSDQDIAGYVNLSWLPESLLKNLEIKAGAMYRYKLRDNYYNEYSLDPVLVNNAPQKFTVIDSAKFAFTGYNAGLGSPVNQNDYHVTENVSAFYAEIKLTLWEKIKILTGARIEQTSLDYMTPMPISFPGRAGSQSYLDILPSLHIRYIIDEKQSIRASYFNSISRPGYFELIPTRVKQDDFDLVGNPYLKRAKAQNFDFRYELFPNPSEQILIGIFAKNITDPIEYSLVRLNGPSSLQLQPNNWGIAKNYGFEFVALKYFQDFGLSANYTYTKSSITTIKQFYHTNAKGSLTTDSVSVTRPMQGQADNIGNVSLLYKNQGAGIDLQLSLVYTGKYISYVNGYAGLDYWAMPVTTLDFSFEIKLSKRINLNLYGKARNLTNSPAITRILQPNNYLTGNLALPGQDSKNSIVVTKESYRESFLLGLRYIF